MTPDPSKGILANKKGNNLEKALLDPARLSRTGAGPVLAARGFGFEEWAAPVEPRWDFAKSRQTGSGRPKAHQTPQPRTALGPLACLLFLFFVSVELLRPSECHKIGCKCLFWPTSLYRS